MLENTVQTLDKMCVARYNAMLHANNICPANHEVVHEGDGIFYFDGERVENYAIYHEAVECFERGDVVLFSPLWNTYVRAPY